MEIEDVFKKAKKYIMREGECPPTLLVETQDAEYQFPAPIGECKTTHERNQALFAAGREFAQTQYETPEAIQAVFLVTEMWFVERDIDTLKGTPSQQPDRKEAISVVALRIIDKAIKQGMHSAEIIRHGSIIDLVPRFQADPGEGAVSSPLLTSFLAGICSAKYNDEEFAESIKRFMEVGEL